MHNIAAVVCTLKGKGKGFSHSLVVIEHWALSRSRCTGSQPACDLNYPPSGRLPLLSVMPAITFQAAEHYRPLAGTHFTVPRKVECSVDLGGWLHTEINCSLRKSNPDTVTHPSTSQVQRRLISLIETNALPLRQTATLVCTLHGR